jgi:hypothetical protein
MTAEQNTQQMVERSKIKPAVGVFNNTPTADWQTMTSALKVTWIAG